MLFIYIIYIGVRLCDFWRNEWFLNDFIKSRDKAPYYIKPFKNPLFCQKSHIILQILLCYLVNIFKEII